MELSARFQWVIVKLRVILLHLAVGPLRIRLLRKMGVKIGRNCIVHTKGFSTEPYLIEIGDHVAIANGVVLMTHDGSVWTLREKHGNLDVFGRIKIGSNTFIGVNALILPGTVIGERCVIGAGSVVRGNIPDGSVVIGNPAKVVFNNRILESLLTNHKDKLMTKDLDFTRKRELIIKHFSNKEHD